MRDYVNVLRHKGFRRLWLGATVSAAGDGMTFVALSWLVLAQLPALLLFAVRL